MMFRLPVCILVFAFAVAAFAQQHTTTVQPQYAQPAASGHDPFQMDWQTGRFRYVPQPYEIQPAGSAYNPYQINWYSGRFDYVPVAPPQQAPVQRPDRGGGTASNYIDTRIDPQAMPSGQTYSIPAPAPTLATVPDEYSIRPTTKPAAAPAKAPSTQPASETLGRIRSAADLANGRWEFDYSTGKWMYVLPSDK